MALADVFKALADPTRREILRILSEGERSAGALADAFPISKPSISHHLTVLKHAQLVRDERRGQQIIYSLDSSVLQDVLAWVFDVLQARPDERSHPGGSMQEVRPRG